MIQEILQRTLSFARGARSLDARPDARPSLLLEGAPASDTALPNRESDADNER